MKKGLAALCLVLPVFAQALPVLAQGEADIKLAYLGQIVLPTGLSLDGIEFGGISGLDYDQAGDVFYAISDDRSQKAPARFYRLKLKIEESGLTGIDILSSHVLRDSEGEAFAEKEIDPEAIRFAPSTGSIFWSSEGDAQGHPALYEAGIDSLFKRAFNVPEAYLPDTNGTRGVRNNLSFEALTISTDGKTLWAATENALVQDGEVASLEDGSLSRLIGFSVDQGAPVAEYVYETGPIFRKAEKEPYYNDNGLTEILKIQPGRFLTLERSYAHGVGNEINLYMAETEAATDVLGSASVTDLAPAPLRKTHLLRIGEGDFGLDVDNIEALSWGPQINGRRTLVLASDNNFNPNGQFTQFVVFVFDQVSG